MGWRGEDKMGGWGIEGAGRERERGGREGGEGKGNARGF
jgi:hypothetical protein